MAAEQRPGVARHPPTAARHHRSDEAPAAGRPGGPGPAGAPFGIIVPMSSASWTPPDLHGRVAVVTGASRGAGRAIGAVLGERGATVYVTGRSVRGQPTTDNLPGTIEESAEEVTRGGGQGIAFRCDHANSGEVESLFRRVREEQGRLDILVNNAWGGYEGELLRPGYFWQAPLRLWDAMFERGLKAHLLASYFAIPLMIESASAAARTKGSQLPGLIVSTVAWDHDKYIGN